MSIFNGIQGVLDKIYASTRTPDNPYMQGVPPAAPVAPQAPAPLSPDGMGVAATPTPAAAPMPPVAAHRNILSIIGGLLAPQAGSFWQEAETKGLPYAHAGVQDYQEGQATAAIARAAALQKIARGEVVTTPTGSVVGVSTNPDGTPKVGELYRPPVTESEKERLIDAWKLAPPGPLKDMYEAAIKGAQNTEPVIAAQARARTATAVASAAARAKYAPKKSNANSSAKLPAGFILNP